MATKYYGINDKWTDDDIENVIEIASEDGTVDSVKVNGEEYGGGGGGEITSAVLTISDPEALGTVIYGLFSNDEFLLDFAGEVYTDQTITARPILIGGTGVFVYDYSQAPTVTGSIQLKPTTNNNKYYLIITGDCSLTV